MKEKYEQFFHLTHDKNKFKNPYLVTSFKQFFCKDNFLFLDVGKMHGARRVITFCCLTAVVPTLLIILPLYLRHSVYSDVTYALAESDVVEIKDGISSIFCQRHTLAMNSTAFNAYQISGEPALSKRRKHIRLKKSIQLPDDTLEYWGFYLLNGSTVSLKVCSRYEGSRILVVEGGRNLRTCGMLEHRKDSYGRHFADGHKTVKVKEVSILYENCINVRMKRK